MRKSDQLVAIYEELKHAVGQTVPAGDLIRLANIILKSYSFEPPENNSLTPYSESRGLHSLPVDDAMNDGGWRVMFFERGQFSDTSLIDAAGFQEMRHKLDFYLGSEWQRRFPPG